MVLTGTIATVCARGGSQGLPGKNIRLLGGRPLIAHSIDQALAYAGIDQVFVSTDDPEIAEIARECGATVPFLRPPELATPKAGKLPVIAHLVDHVEAAGVTVERIVDLQPTSPLRCLQDIDDCLAALDEQTDCVVSACVSEANPYFNLVELDGDGHVHLSKGEPGRIVARQQAPAVYAVNGAIYVWHRSTLDKGVLGGRTRLHVMPRERSIDIDSALDFQIVELLMNGNANGR